MEAATLFDDSSNSSIDLPEEIMIDILLRLPAKSLLKLRCVCKLWHSLISSSQFINTHLNLLSNNPNNYSLIFCFCPRKFYTCSISSILTSRASINPINQVFPLEENMDTIVGACNGLLCIRTLSNALYLCNPTTRKMKKIKYEIEDLNFATYGFCYDEVNDDYKVVEINEANNGSSTKANVYSLRDNCWTEIEGLEDVLIYDFDHGICVSGTLNWCARFHYNHIWFIISLNIATYVYTEVELPKLVTPEDEDGNDWSLGEIGGCLSVIYRYNEDRTDIWVMKEFNVKESWIKLMSIPYILCKDIVDFPIFESGNGELIFEQDSYVTVYNTRNSSSRNLEIRGRNGNLIDWEVLHPYIETLVRLTL